LIYTLVVMTALVAVASLAVDLGRAQLAKSELETAADAAGRAACAVLPKGGVSAAKSAAVAAAAANQCDGSAVVLDPATDLTFGTWDSTKRTFTPTPASGSPAPNAVTVTLSRTAAQGNAIPMMFGKVIGLNSCDIHKSTIIAAPENMGEYAIIGLEGVTMTGTSSTDSYDSSKGPYSASNTGHKGSIASNGDIALTGNGEIDGDARNGIGKSTTTGGTAQVTGQIAPLTTPLKLPSVTLPSSYIDLGDVYQSSGTVHIPGGVYLFRSITLSGTAHIVWDGPVTFYVRDSYALSGSVVIDTYQNIPANRIMNFLPTCKTATWSGSHSCVGELYAPDTDFSVGGSAELFGRITAKTIKLTGNGGMHYDEALPPLGGDKTNQTIRRVR
jgi:hypothetical protein